MLRLSILSNIDRDVASGVKPTSFIPTIKPLPTEIQPRFLFGVTSGKSPDYFFFLKGCRKVICYHLFFFFTNYKTWEEFKSKIKMDHSTRFAS